MVLCDVAEGVLELVVRQTADLGRLAAWNQRHVQHVNVDAHVHLATFAKLVKHRRHPALPELLDGHDVIAPRQRVGNVRLVVAQAADTYLDDPSDVGQLGNQADGVAVAEGDAVQEGQIVHVRVEMDDVERL